ncbi:hypothetical protein [Paenibacillus sp. FSL K6-2859]|jgi:hypothetical protein|uniref:hypothetical protein n=1 Tax=Paenibacillus sp. FSL K6-2859 TaxID=2921482 RepID=UPI0030F74380
MKSTEKKELLSRPYAERQLIVVLSDDQIKAQQRYTEEQVESKFVKALRTISTIIAPSPIALAEATLEIYKGILNLREQGIKTLSISQSEASRIKFPPGHPRFGVLYIAHPAAPNVYFPFAQFHRLTFEHKFSEAVILLMSLGADFLEVHHINGWSKEFSSKMDISIPHVNVGGGFEASSANKSGSEILFTANFIGNASSALPDNLVWFYHEPTWQQIAEGRLKYGMKDFSLSVRYEDDLGVNMGLKAAATKAKLEIGGRFEDHQSTMWEIVGNFG